jgi:hypothetical protein
MSPSREFTGARTAHLALKRALPLPAGVPFEGASNPVAISNGRLYTGNLNHFVYSLDPDRACAYCQDNCQVGVFGALGRGDRVSLIDARLYLPKEWTDDAARCEEACVPRAQQVHRTEPELAEEIVRHARAIGVRFEWVGMDGGYGQSLGLLESLHAQGEVFVADIHSDRHVYLQDPAPHLPQQKSGSGRKPLGLRYHSNAQSIEVRKWLQKQPASARRPQTLRDTTRGICASR